jgi:RecA-family ATPase
MAADVNGDLLGLPEYEFCRQWEDLPAAGKADLPADYRRDCIERYRRATPYVDASIDRTEKATSSVTRAKPNGEDRPKCEPPPDPELLDLDALSDVEPAPPSFVVEGWMPAFAATLLAGHGESAKSWIALHLAVCMALGIPFFGYRCERLRVLFYAAEDRKDVLHWRLARICASLGVRLADLAGWLYLYDATESDNVLYWGNAPTPAERITARYDWLRAKVAEHGIEALMLDAVTDAFDANENIRALVKDFVRACLRLGPLRALLLISHVNRATALAPKTTEGYSGSTHWHNACRARWYLRVERDDNDEDGEDQADAEEDAPRVLEAQKSNYGRKPPSIRLLWDAEARTFRAETLAAERGGIVDSIRDRNNRKAILGLLAECEAIGRRVASSQTANNNAGVILAERKGFPREFRRKDRRPGLFKLLRELQEAGLIAEATVKSASRHPVGVWQLTDAGRAEIRA